MIDEQIVDAVEQLPTTDERLEGRILRTLYRKNYLSEGWLANYVHDRINSPNWQSCLSRLLAENLIELVPVFYYGNARRIALTERGREKAKALAAR
jgi:DNA-binding MarR family transcriptional regulator